MLLDIGLGLDMTSGAQTEKKTDKLEYIEIFFLSYHSLKDGVNTSWGQLMGYGKICVSYISENGVNISNT